MMMMRIRREIGDWENAVEILKGYKPEGIHLDDLLEGHSLGYIRWLVMEVFRQWLVIDGIMDRNMKRRPRPVTESILRLALAECLNREAAFHPKIVHHAVGTGGSLGLSKAERGFINGLLRGILRKGELEADHLGESHPQWLKDRWIGEFGNETTEQLMRWNQSVPVLTVRCPECPSYAEPTQWDGFFAIQPGKVPEAVEYINAGNAYIQDPFTRIPPELLQVRPGEQVLDLCAAPGGKSRLLAEALAGSGRLVLIDKPGNRLERLKANARHFGDPAPEIIGIPLQDLEESGDLHNLETGSFDAVLIDVPCSNTGVIQKRPDVKLRLGNARIARMAEQQLAMLGHAARWVRPGGRLVYSTCSLEREENRGVVDAFLQAFPDWHLQRAVMSYPWICGHDGGGAFLLTRTVPA